MSKPLASLAIALCLVGNLAKAESVGGTVYSVFVDQNGAIAVLLNANTAEMKIIKDDFNAKGNCGTLPPNPYLGSVHPSDVVKSVLISAAMTGQKISVETGPYSASNQCVGAWLPIDTVTIYGPAK